MTKVSKTINTYCRNNPNIFKQLILLEISKTECPRKKMLMSVSTFTFFSKLK